MTTTAIGILLIVQCVVLWAIMAALHRHTTQLEVLRKRLDALRRPHDATPAGERNSDAGGNADSGAARTSDGPGSQRTLRGVRR